MSLLGHIFGGEALSGPDAQLDDAMREQIDLQRQIEEDAALDCFMDTVRWLAADISRQFSVDHDAVHEHLLAMPDEQVRHLASPFGWVWLAHDAARALGIDNPLLLKITVH